MTKIRNSEIIDVKTWIKPRITYKCKGERGMKQIQYIYEDEDSFREKLLAVRAESIKLNASNTLIRILSTITDENVICNICSIIDRDFPEAIYAGCTTNANISKREHIIVNGKKHCTIVPVPEAAEYIVNLFKEYRDNNYTIQGMETAFKHQGRRTVNGNFFSSATLYKLLSMPYCAPATPEIWDYYSGKGCTMIDDRNTWDGTTGVMIYGRRSDKSDGFKVQPVQNWVVVKGIHEPFMDAKLWLDVQHQFKHNSFERKKKYDTPLLKGTLRCAKCGYMMQVARQKMAHGRISSSYFCLKRQRQGIEACDMKYVSCQALDEKVLEIFSEIEADPTSIRKYAQVSEATDNLALQIKKAEKKAASIRNRIKRLTESLAEGSAASKYIVAQIESEDLLLSSTERDIEMLKSRERQLALSERNSENRAESIARMMHTLSDLSAEEKNAIVKEVVQECTWDGSTLILRL